MYSYRGSTYKESILEDMLDIFNQELSRIQTVTMRNLKPSNPKFIKNFDKNGKKFCFLQGLNSHLEDKYSELGKLMRQKINGVKLSDTDTVRLTNMAREELRTMMQDRADSILKDWSAKGIIKAAKNIKNAGSTEAQVRENLENFIWNDALAAMNIMELFITDPAYYKDAEDLQKRLAQIHAPGLRGNIYATDFEGERVSDGISRTAYLDDFEGVMSNIIDNVTIVFDRRIANAKSSTERRGLEVLKDSLVRPRTYKDNGEIDDEGGLFYNINVTDAQAYNSPTSYRKKAFIFGKWSKDAEKVYKNVLNKIRGGNYTYNDLKIAFQVLKPFVYSQMKKDSGVPNAPMTKLKSPVQNKNSEYLLILADAILQGENTGKPNLLRAIFEVMEESHFTEDGKYKRNGIDTIQFGSAVKSSLTGTINLNRFINHPNGEALAKAYLKSCLYKSETVDTTRINPETSEMETVPLTRLTNEYNTDFVQEFSYEDYCLQQEVPEHFKEHYQVHGSQLRYIVVSELEDVDANGNEIIYHIGEREVNAKEFKKEYEDTIAENIEESIQELSDILNLNSLSLRDRNVALSKILQKEILSSPRYGVDLYLACSVDESGQFRIPLGDPIQSKRIEQLINSVIKNRVNKQKIAGGPVVQVSNFGTSRQLNIRFKDKVNGGLLMTRSEWEAQGSKESTYKEYVENNQGGIAYFEVFAPIYTNDLFEKFADNEGNIDINVIEQINPDLLKLIGYRIPTEAKYSMAPMKIVGFLPREAGDGIMMPYDITLLTGSDFDVDKMYLMRKEITIATKFNLKEGENMTEAEKDYFENNKEDIGRYLREAINLKGKTTKSERDAIIKDAKAWADIARKRENENYQAKLDEIEQKYSNIDDEVETKRGKKRHKNDVNKQYRRALRVEAYRHQVALQKIDAGEQSRVLNRINRLEERKVRDKISDFLKAFKRTNSQLDDPLMREIRKAYLQYTYKTMEPTSGRTFRNNKIVDMTYEVLTHESSAAEILNPGGFDPEKRMGYLF